MECRGGDDCVGPASECVEGACEVCDPSTGAGCDAATPVCVDEPDNNRCIECRGDGDCNGEQCVSETCVVCDDADNAGCGGDTPWCLADADGRRCAACRGDDDCDGTEQCVNDACQLCDPIDGAGCPADTPNCVDGGNGLSVLPVETIAIVPMPMPLSVTLEPAFVASWAAMPVAMGQSFVSSTMANSSV